MQICSGGRYSSHDEIVYDGRDCPLCELMVERDAISDRLSDAEGQLEETNKENVELQLQVNKLESKVADLEDELAYEKSKGQ